jgi:hypothetical protein
MRRFKFRGSGRWCLGRELTMLELVPGGARDVWQDLALFAKPVEISW